jgi:hypothetical protein
MSIVVGDPCQNLFQDEGRGMEVLFPKGKSKHQGTNSCLRARQWCGERLVANGANSSKGVSASPTRACRGQSGLGEVDLGKRHSARQLELNIEEPVLSLGFFPSPGLAVARKNSEYD